MPQLSFRINEVADCSRIWTFAALGIHDGVAALEDSLTLSTARRFRRERGFGRASTLVMVLILSFDVITHSKCRQCIGAL